MNREQMENKTKATISLTSISQSVSQSINQSINQAINQSSFT